MKHQHCVKLTPLTIQTNVIIDNPTLTINIKDLSAEELSKICDQFRKDMFLYASKKDPNLKNTIWTLDDFE